MKTFVSTILILSIISFQLSEMLIYFSFKINQETIAENLCIEKDVEDSSCKGCCQLKKKLNEQKEQKEELPPSQENKQNYDFIVIDLINPMIGANYYSNQRFEYIENYRFSNSHGIFHPPKMIV